jgi:hypothetical protein
MRIALRTLARPFIVSARATARQLRLLALVTAMLVVPASVNAQTEAFTDRSSEAQEVKAVVERFYKLETASRWTRMATPPRSRFGATSRR